MTSPVNGSEVRERFADDQQWPEQVDVDLAVELILCQFRDRHRLINSGIVDQNVERAESSLRPLEKLDDIGGLRDIRLNRDGTATLSGNRIDDGCRAGLVAR